MKNLTKYCLTLLSELCIYTNLLIFLVKKEEICFLFRIINQNIKLKGVML